MRDEIRFGFTAYPIEVAINDRGLGGPNWTSSNLSFVMVDLLQTCLRFFRH